MYIHPLMLGLLGLLPLVSWFMGSAHGRDRCGSAVRSVVFSAWKMGVLDERQRKILERALEQRM